MYKNITFIYGATSANIRVNCTNVQSFLDAHGPTYGVPESGVTFRVNGSAATGSTTLNDGDTLTVDKASGTKG